jgi:SAM-dependent methyltransferase
VLTPHTAEEMSVPESFDPHPLLSRLYPEAKVGGFSKLDGQVEFYTRVNALIDANSRVLDFGAGRGYWAVEPMPEMSRRLRMLRGRVAEVVGADVDPVVEHNPTVDRSVVLAQGQPLPFDDATFDLVIADYVLEHVTPDDAGDVASELMRVLRRGGWLAARTPNKWGMIGIGARAVPNHLHTTLLARLQPGRKAEDVFPTQYAMNTRSDLRRLFAGHDVHVYGHTSEPTYFGRSKTAWRLAAGLGRITPPRLEPTLMIFVQKR